jgi:hypothetical protein
VDHLVPRVVTFDTAYTASARVGLAFQEEIEDFEMLMPSDELHIDCTLIYQKKETTINGNTTEIPQIKSPPKTEGSLITSFQHLFNEQMQFSDMEIHAGETIFPDHKVVLAARSPVFHAKLQSDRFSENKTNVIKIKDLAAPVVKEMLRFIYTDRVENMEELASELLIASGKYLIDLLKMKCEAFLAQSMTVENCCDLLSLAQTYSATELKKVAMDFFLLHSCEVSKTDGWKELKLTHPTLGFEVSETMIERSSTKVSCGEGAVSQYSFDHSEEEEEDSVVSS